MWKPSPNGVTGEAVKQRPERSREENASRSAGGTEQTAHGILGEGSDGRASGDPDYDEVVGLSEVVIAPHITDTILESDRGPRGGLLPCATPRQSRINQCHVAHRCPPEQSAGLKHRSRAARSSSKINKAPAPIKPVSASSSAPIGISDEMSTGHTGLHVQNRAPGGRANDNHSGITQWQTLSLLRASSLRKASPCSKIW